jgi:RNA polymerase sigma-70 factor (ECF subfamily)
VLEDGDIIRRCQGGQRGLIDTLIDRYQTDLYSLCVKLTRGGPDADDLFQDTWVRVMKRIDSFSPENNFKTWLFTICTNRYRDMYRWRKRWWHRVRQFGSKEDFEAELELVESQEAGPAELAVSKEEKASVRQAVDSLEDTFRLPVVLHYFHEMSTAEIGEVLGIPQGTVKTRLHGARDKLRRALEGEGHGR